MANFCLTILEREFPKNARKNAANKYGIDNRVLQEVGNLAANKGGGRSARKADGIASDLTKDESFLIEEAVKAMILRLTDVSFDRDERYPKITLEDLSIV